MDIKDRIMDIHDWIIDIDVRIMDIHNINNWFVDGLDRGMAVDPMASFLPFHDRPLSLRFGSFNNLGHILSDGFHSHFKRWKFNFIIINFLVIRKKCACVYSIGLVCYMQKNRDWLIRIWISWSKNKSAPAKFESEKTNCATNLNYNLIIIREKDHWPQCILRSLLQFLVIKLCPKIMNNDVYMCITLHCGVRSGEHMTTYQTN